jgi:hypothetical protein
MEQKDAMNLKEQEFFVDAGVVAEFLGVARETVLALARRGELPISAKIRIDPNL